MPTCYETFMDHLHSNDSRGLNSFWPQDLNTDFEFDLQSDPFQNVLEIAPHFTGASGHGSDASSRNAAYSNVLGNRTSSATRDSTVHPDYETTHILSALKMARALHASPTVCLSFAGARPSVSDLAEARSIDSVLMKNREALQLVSSILQNVTSTSSQLQLLLTVICSKVAAWYRAIARNSLERTTSVKLDQPINNPGNVLKASNEELVERVLHQPLKFGAYSFDSALETRIRAMVVLNELQYVEKLFTNLSRHMASSELGGLSSGVTNSSMQGRADRSSFASGPDEGTVAGEAARRRMNEFLCTQLEAVKAEVRAMLTPY